MNKQLYMMNIDVMTNLLSTDQDLLSTYHIAAPNTAEICAKVTMEDLNNSGVEVTLLKDNDKIIGYYGIEKGISMDYLTGFFIVPKYRTKDTITKFWNEIDSKFDKDYYVGVYPKNTRAINFLNKKTNQQFYTEQGVFFKVKR